MENLSPESAVGGTDKIADFRGMLRAELGRRQVKNPAYSMRAFARDLGLSASGLSEVLSGKHSLSLRRAVIVSQRLGLSGHESDDFIASATMKVMGIPVNSISTRKGGQSASPISAEPSASITLSAPSAKALLAELQALLENRLNSSMSCGKTGEIRLDLRINVED